MKATATVTLFHAHNACPLPVDPQGVVKNLPRPQILIADASSSNPPSRKHPINHKAQGFRRREGVRCSAEVFQGVSSGGTVT